MRVVRKIFHFSLAYSPGFKNQVRCGWRLHQIRVGYIVVVNGSIPLLLGAVQLLRLQRDLATP